MTGPNRDLSSVGSADDAPEAVVEVTQEEINQFGELLDGIQRFLMSIDFRLRQVEALIYGATVAQDEAEAEDILPDPPGPDPVD